MSIWNILWPFGYFYDHWLYFSPFWYAEEKKCGNHENENFHLFASDLHQRPVQLHPDEDRGREVRQGRQVLAGPIRRNTFTKGDKLLLLPLA
jgi:hypothetical protein